MEADDPVAVYMLNDPYQAELIKTVLRGEGIFCELDGERQAGLSDILEIGVLVRAPRRRPRLQDYPTARVAAERTSWSGAI